MSRPGAKRLDVALVELGLAPSRSKAQELIQNGEVEVQVAGAWTRITQTSFTLKELTPASVRLNADAALLKYVSRGGLKLEGALRHLKLDVAGLRALDVGLSTGGFSDCLLKAGCREVVGLDVGHDQLAPALRGEKRLKNFEGVNVRDLKTHGGLVAEIQKGVDLCVVDVSFISLRLVIPALAEVLAKGTGLLTLVKPQFEVGPEGLDKHGVVRDEALFADVKDHTLRALAKYGFTFKDYFPSAIKGQDGNQEFFAYSLRA